MSLHEQTCQANVKTALLTELSIEKLQKKIQQWKIDLIKKNISRSFKFKNYPQTLIFINAVAEIVQRENHHPEITFGYNSCTIQYSTHSAGGITPFDCICAAHIDQLFSRQDFQL